MERNYKNQRNKKYKDESRSRLSSIMKKKIQTTMIGAISSIEDHFSFLWEEDSSQAREMQELFQQVRSEILDKGNHQLRNVDVELSQYEVEWNRYTVNLPVRRLHGE